LADASAARALCDALDFSPGPSMLCIIMIKWGGTFIFGGSFLPVGFLSLTVGVLEFVLLLLL